MTQNLESIIRPFQTTEVSPSQTYFEAGEVGSPPLIVLQYGKGGSGKVLTGSYSYSATFYCDGSETEKAIAEFRKQTGQGSGGGEGGGGGG